jgi:hypothetical protein
LSEIDERVKCKPLLARLRRDETLVLDLFVVEQKLVRSRAETPPNRELCKRVVLTLHVSWTTNQTIKAATMRSISLRILVAVRRSLAAPRACQSRQRISATTSGMTAVWFVTGVPPEWSRTWFGEGHSTATSW